ncbi:hypothetical protein [Nitrosococcus wardiae]|uniref:Uncharacterized protein n=1 Tax=Nitrosococcus wardiae TaxID=1814290 RepID=A0A4P7BXT5_9GAMM|nr:hypothetical protein [Nitrosococcus wardiae]QBQ54973.1 hypothetical protein E3U44_10945 [Nitrosococcus wardiae]
MTEQQYQAYELIFFSLAFAIVVFFHFYFRVEDWDWLLLSGILTALLGLWLVKFIPRKINHTLTRLFNRKVISLDSAQEDHLRKELKERAAIWATASGGLVGSAVLISFIIKNGLPYPAAQIPLTLFEAIGGYIVGRHLGIMASYGRLGHWLKRQGIRIQIKPGYPDGAVGLKPVGDFYFFQAMLLALPVLYLFLWWLMMPLWPRYEAWRNIYLGLLPVAITFEVIAFLVPVWFFHREMQKQKMQLLREADVLGQEINDVETTLIESQDPAQRELLKDRLSFMTKRYGEIEHMPTWPVNAKTWRYFFINNLTLILLPLLSEFIKMLVNPLIKIMNKLL